MKEKHGKPPVVILFSIQFCYPVGAFYLLRCTRIHVSYGLVSLRSRWFGGLLSSPHVAQRRCSSGVLGEAGSRKLRERGRNLQPFGYWMFPMFSLQREFIPDYCIRRDSFQ